MYGVLYTKHTKNLLLNVWFLIFLAQRAEFSCEVGSVFDHRSWDILFLLVRLSLAPCKAQFLL